MPSLHIRDLLQYEVLHRAMREHATQQLRGRHPDDLFTITNIDVSYEQELVTIEYSRVSIEDYCDHPASAVALVIPFPDFISKPPPQKRKWVKQ